MRRLALLLFLVGCYKEHTFGDCELSCTNELGCPSGLSCLDGMCRESGASGTCTHQTNDADVDAPGPDTDGDTIPDSVDNCPSIANLDQYDEDGDMIGDVCDMCPISSNNNDTDHDGVGDDCDPSNATQDHIVLFEGFNVAPAGGTQMGTNAWTFGNGVAKNDALGPAYYLWDSSSSVTATIYTSVSLHPYSATPNIVGTVMGADTTTMIGAACANVVRQDSFRELGVVDVSQNPPVEAMGATGSYFLSDQAYAIRESAAGGTTVCDRNQYDVSALVTTSSSGKMGLYAWNAHATYDYVLIVGH